MKGIILDKNLEAVFSDALQDWVNNIERYTNEFDNNDTLYYYNERATVSTLAASLYKSGYFILEEFSTNKSVDGEVKTGRVDLFFAKDVYGLTKSYFGAVVEAKQVYVNLSDNYNGSMAIKTSFSKAEQDTINSFNKQYHTNSYAITFIVPKVKFKDKEYSKERCKNLITEIQELNEHHGIAYIFPKKCELCYETYFYPGIICLIKEIKHSSFN
ncbi:MAG: hypothetical protein DRG78_05940 [Epsilonproteobacteria bacterium]|nr:MAG: hypothetical protein DRG78_05940 [Campylobacterota bacterium]